MQLSVSTKGNGYKTLVFLHHAGGASRTWERQVNDPLFEKYTRVCIDLPGHGASPPLEKYDLPSLGAAIGNALQQLKTNGYLLVTSSIAGCIAAEALPGLQSCKGLFIAGGCLLGGNVTPATLMRPFEHGMVMFEAAPSDESLDLYLEGQITNPETTVIATLHADYRSTDPAFRTGLAASLGEGKWSDQIGNVEKAGIPVAFVYGGEEKIIDHKYLDATVPHKWRGAAQILDSAGHLPHLDRPAEFNLLLTEFISDAWPD